MDTVKGKGSSGLATVQLSEEKVVGHAYRLCCSCSSQITVGSKAVPPIATIDSLQQRGNYNT